MFLVDVILSPYAASLLSAWTNKLQDANCNELKHHWSWSK